MGKRRVKWKALPPPDPKVKRSMHVMTGGPYDGQRICKPDRTHWSTAVIAVGQWRGRYVGGVWQES